MDAPIKTCFIAMPVSTSNDHAEKFGDKNHWKHVLETLFVPAVEKAGFQALLPTAQGSHMIHAQIVQHLSQADMVLVDISHNNPNVFFELGVRTSVNKPIALVRCDASVSIPFDVNGINTHAYDPALKAWHIDQEIEAVAEHLRQADRSCAGENPMWRQFGMQLKATEPTVGGSKEEAQLALLTRQVGELLEQGTMPAQPVRSFTGDESALAEERRMMARRRVKEASKNYQVPIRLVPSRDGHYWLSFLTPATSNEEAERYAMFMEQVAVIGDKYDVDFRVQK